MQLKRCFITIHAKHLMAFQDVGAFLKHGIRVVELDESDWKEIFKKDM